MAVVDLTITRIETSIPQSSSKLLDHDGRSTSHSFVVDQLCRGYGIDPAAEFLPESGDLESPFACEFTTRIFDMALAPSLSVLTGADRMERPDIIVVCQTGIDSEYGKNESVALRLQCATKTRHIAFGITSLGGAGLFKAVEIVDALMQMEPKRRRALITCVERWRSPYPRKICGFPPLGDGAAALLAVKGRAPGWHVRATRTKTKLGEDIQSGRDCCGRRPDPRRVAAVIADVLREANWTTADVSVVVSPNMATGYVLAVLEEAALLGVESFFPCSDEEVGFLASVDPAMGLAWTARQRKVLPRILLWSVGFSEVVGAAAIEWSGATDAPGDHPDGWPPC